MNQFRHGQIVVAKTMPTGPFAQVISTSRDGKWVNVWANVDGGYRKRMKAESLMEFCFLCEGQGSVPCCNHSQCNGSDRPCPGCNRDGEE